MDDSLRALERSAAQGDPDAKERLARERERAGLEGQCPANALSLEREAAVRAELFRFWPAQRQTHGARWCLFARREPDWPRGIRLDRAPYRP